MNGYIDKNDTKLGDDMSLDKSSVKARVKEYILNEFLLGEPAESLTDDVLLISDGILDSLATLRLVSFIEEQFDVAVPPHQIDVDHLDRLGDITDTILANS